ncbi:orotidine-5'-phosphate decarboxylase [Desulfuromonas acetoxidans]|uniref:Orotidine 5'-phosphate decarboxylase n=1 Tax=Desulfuromonas acetoxidans (strain DSM 684 / 11070) TaxID=281689 RepID=Q1JXE4_DESA6|nr:orotidine-5'-phosphate decarboxylase [Desulfuromonas acetoxidans]EAT14848.1 orotidine 5'-phosphate decarboxylase [Desulfuromonas acetoxidans DSM 684]MBF0644070.1 orotidine-5'-phosphate decarboxylase [Desulfuromonas acetoxidans]NVD23308.1 orotidine-5'-phosphate decarboxylase [Desulfuromonas acetoxidans]NVE15451.1 orotidine-5'-phosphate decarboxylase [Desulfuromonas acetoxidans]
MKDRLIFALDVDSYDEARQWVRILADEVGMFKVGKQLFTRCGPQIVDMIRQAGGGVFLDLKYHDIPNTVAKAGIEAARMGVQMFNVHALGGGKMMRTMVDEVREAAVKEGFPVPITLAVTILTSSSEEDLRQVGIDLPVTQMVPRLATLARESGLHGVVASAQELPLIRQACGGDFVVVTPGVRPATAARDDQQRVMTPGEAIAAGSDYLVVGRPISKADDPVLAARSIVAEMTEAGA